MSAIEATSFQIANIGSTIFTITKPGGSQDTIAPSQTETYNPQGIYLADVGGIQSFDIDFTNGNLKINNLNSGPAGTAATVKAFLN